jgi:hypothetical protein
VTISLASRSRWKWSTTIVACGSDCRTARAYAAHGSIATTSMPSRQAWSRASSQVHTAAEERPGVSPRITRAEDRSRLVRLVIHGSWRTHRPVSGSRHQRGRRVRVSSMPNQATGGGSVGNAAAARTATSLTNHHDTPYSAAILE